MDALNELMDILISSGMSENDAYYLLSKFLEEEAYDFVEYMKGFKSINTMIN